MSSELPPGVSPKAFPLANSDLTAAIIELVSQAQGNKQLRKGANEVTKMLNRSVAEIVIIAGDTDPIEIAMHLPLLCEDKGVPYIFIPSRAALGRACAVSRSVIACSITKKDHSRLKKNIDALRIQIEKTAISS
jgi:U4/U6 small nuclear ribonucleoprotein SNU13